ncbi:Na+/H+ antiporter NhaC family protein [Allosalinactinospora lopnorensis]|uniref:Na+/H+ antiporter NhaC family protein n=1 Tax=Allosalinactinospora lopnorensis TaxID=1352348 RepID=UPI0009E289EC|nr:Na+/H+ antiporter NhaC family protein [Allosalinactinospora lopnorensis]
MTATWFSILPPLLAIGLALLTRQILPSLLAGVWLGAWLVEGVTLKGLGISLLDTVGVYVVDALSDPDHVMIIVFSLMIGGMVGIIRRNGGTDGIVKLVTRWASTPRRGQAATGGLGVAVFFDDYANTLVVGNTMRPVTDRLRISREKLAYLVDSTAAPVATLGLFTTWIGFQVGLLGEAADGIGLERTGFAVFVESLAYAFYPVLAVVLVFAIAASGRDFGPMLKAERRAREGQVLRPGSQLGNSEALAEELQPDERTPRRLVNAVVPIVVLITTTLIGLIVTGEGDNAMEVMGDGDAFSALLWGSLLAVLVAGVMSVGQRILTLSETVASWFSGVTSMLYVVIILTMAWSLSALTEELGTAEFLAGALGDAIPAALLPAILFVIAAAVAFATGTSWGTMGILTPLAVPVAWAVLEAQGNAFPEGHPILFASVSTVLAGAVWGDHCSPISDTTVISSLASQCDVIDHVRTQIPYALYAGAVALVFGLIPVGFGLPWWLAFPMAVVVLVAGLRLIGKQSPAPAEEAPGETRIAADS